MPIPLLIAAALTLPPKPAPDTPHPLPCHSDQLSLNTDQENGSFNGMSHSGTLLVLRNLSAQPCTLPAYPKITFSTNNKALPTRPQPTRPQSPNTAPKYPASATQPIIAPGAELTATLRWVSSPVYPNSQCITPTQIAVTIQNETQTAPFTGHLCGKKPNPIPYQVSPLTPDPPYQPSKSNQ